jgi:hypothetical protein
MSVVVDNMEASEMQEDSIARHKPKRGIAVRSCNIFISSVHFAWFPTASNSDRNVNMSSNFELNGCNLTLNGKELFCSLEFNCLEI